MAEEIKKVVSIETKGTNSIKGLKNQIKDLKKELESLEIGTEEYERSLNKLTQAQKKYNEINADLRARSATQQKQFVNLAEFSEGLGKSFTALTGVVGMLGSENEELNEVLKKVAYSIQIIGGIDGFTKIARQIPNIKVQFGDWLKNLGLIKDRINDISKTDLSKINAGGANAEGNGVTSNGIIKKGDVDNIKNYNTEVERQNSFFGQNKTARDEVVRTIEKEIAENDKLVKSEEFAMNTSNHLLESAKNRANGLTELIELENKYQTGQKLSSLEEERRITLSKKYGSNIDDLISKSKEANRTVDSLRESIKKSDEIISNTSKSTEILTKKTKKLANTGSAIANLFRSVGSTVGWTLLITGILAALGALWKWISGLKTAAKEQRELNKAIKESTAQIASQGVVVLKELAYAYQKVGDTAEAKKKFLEQFKDKIAETGIAINDVNKADDVFIKNTDKYIQALTARAKAQAMENKAVELYEAYLTKKADLEDKIEQRQSRAKFFENSTTGGSFWGIRAKLAQDELAESKEKIEKTLKSLFEDVAGINSEWNGFWAQMTATVETNVDEAANALEDAKKRDIELLAQFQDEALKTQMSSMDRELAELADKYKERLDLARKYGEDTKQIEEAYQIELTEILNRYQKEQEDAEKDAIEARWQAFQDKLERIRRENETSKLKEPREQTFKTRYTQGASAVFGLNGPFGATGELFTYQSKEDLDNQYTAQVKYNNDIFNLTKSRIEQENALLNAQLENSELTADKRLEIERMLAENEMALSDAKLANEEANLKAYQNVQEARQQALQATLSVASDIAGSMAQILGEETAAGKAFAVTQAIIDTYASANAAYKSMAGIPIVGPALGIAAAAAAVASGVANVKSILSTQVGSTSVSASVPAPAALNVAPVEYTRNLLGDKETEVLNNPVKCYVLESDITNTQSKVQVTENNASF